MEGVVKLVNEESDVFAVETDDEFTVFELVKTDHIETGDVVSGALDSAVCSKLFKLLERRYVHDTGPTLEATEALVYSD